MLKLSKKADYALMAVTHLAVRPDRPSISAREIAEEHDIPLELLAKVLQRLAHHGLVVSHHGLRGGYRLARSAAEMSVAQVVEAIEGPLTLTACTETDESCGQYAKCNVRTPLWRVKERVLAALATYSVAEIARDALAASSDRPLTVQVSATRQSGALMDAS